MKEEGMQELYEKLETLKTINGIDDILNDINTIQKMMNINSYDKNKFLELEAKYSIEITFFVELERENGIVFDERYDDPELQLLLNLRYRLYRIAVYKILKHKEKEIPKEFIRADYSDLINFI